MTGIVATITAVNTVLLGTAIGAGLALAACAARRQQGAAP